MKKINPWLIFFFGLIIGGIIIYLSLSGNYSKTSSSLSSDAQAINQMLGNYPLPSSTPSYDQQRQCGIDAREFMKQYQSSQVLIESEYSTELQACIVYTENVFPSSDKNVYNVTTNSLLGGYMYIAQTSKYPSTSQYWISTKVNPGGEDVSQKVFSSYIEYLGLQINQ